MDPLRWLRSLAGAVALSAAFGCTSSDASPDGAAPDALPVGADVSAPEIAAAADAPATDLFAPLDVPYESAPAPPDAGSAGADAPRCPGENPAARCRATAQECLPSSCGCTEQGWACTADCGGGRRCGDGGADGPAMRVCTPGANQTCNDNPALSSIHGRCLPDGTCACDLGPGPNPATGRCR